MPVIGIPIAPSDLPSNLYVKSVNASTLYGESVLERRPGVRTFAGAENAFSVALINDDGEHIIADDSFTFKCRFAEAIKNTTLIEEVTGDILDVDYSIVQFEIPTSVSDIAGVYIASVGIFISDKLRHTYNIWIYNEPSVWSSIDKSAALPSLDEIRTLLRDSSPVENEILNARQFGIEEYAQAAVETVRLWNDTPPFIGDLTTINFPSHHIYVNGMMYFLFEMLVEWYRKNRLPYSAGGVNIDDMNKLQEYMAEAQQKFQEVRILIQRSKSSLNIIGGFGKIG